MNNCVAAPSKNSCATRLATRLVFLVAGFGLACWAPLVPFAKNRLEVSEGQLGLLLLCLGVGSIIAMQVAALTSAKFGSRSAIVSGGLGVAVTLPFLAICSTPLTLGIALFCFGASLGAMDVAMNIHAIDVEADADKPLISGFHAMFSVGGFAGAGFITFILSAGASPIMAVLLCVVPLIAAMAIAGPRLLQSQGAQDARFIAPRGIVLLIAILAALCFLMEGAVLDWGALLLTQSKSVPAAQGGLAYMAFALAMTAGRLSGDVLVARLGDRAMVFWGGVLTVAGIVLLLLCSGKVLAIISFVLMGLGASNVVPILFRRAGSQTAMPAAAAIGAVTTVAYAGVLVGPAGIGFVAQAIGLHAAFWILAVALCLVPLTAKRVTATVSV